KPYNPLEAPETKITATSDERDVAGLGIYIAKSIMDEVHYDYVGNHNVLTLIKYKKY
ncbi:MAG: ATP-binding protein, partial [Bacilli bacterium]|nr:ATP-binding protein [Bacilli bacterium]